MVGDTWEKVGRSSGWTAGAIANVCTDEYFTGYYLSCQTLVNLTSMHGDSGSGVFLWDGNGSYNITFSGILAGATVWDHNDSNGNGVFSQIYMQIYPNIEVDFGDYFTVHP